MKYTQMNKISIREIVNTSIRVYTGPRGANTGIVDVGAELADVGSGIEADAKALDGTVDFGEVLNSKADVVAHVDDVRRFA